ncbi:three prime repair exonuclease 4 [Fundulus heteroclitus]|uniref:three prime repair exonuclease 4 n=1 Tax=Fundulus heteroclitus TaxID=8078 RepID=UPI00165BE476|nr:three prime repair exonuclease 4 [Fundulus heteroclitus]
MQAGTGAEENSEQLPLVFFDLETTGLGQDCEIIQLAAVSGGHSLNLYVLPRCRIQPGAARLTGFKVRRQRLYLHHRLVFTNSLKEVVVAFVTFLQMLGRPLLVGHNIRSFDCPLLARALDQLDLRAEFQASVSGCVDTLPLARELLRDRGLRSFRQENLVRELLGINYKAHDALEDVRALQELYSYLQPAPEFVCRHTFTLDSMNCKPAELHNRKLAGQRPLLENSRQTGKLTKHDGEVDGLEHKDT